MRIELYQDNKTAGVVIDWRNVTDVMIAPKIPEITFVVNHLPHEITWEYETLEDRDRDLEIIKHYLKAMGEDVNPPRERVEVFVISEERELVPVWLTKDQFSFLKSVAYAKNRGKETTYTVNNETYIHYEIN